MGISMATADPLSRPSAFSADATDLQIISPLERWIININSQ